MHVTFTFRHVLQAMYVRTVWSYTCTYVCKFVASSIYTLRFGANKIDASCFCKVVKPPRWWQGWWYTSIHKYTVRRYTAIELGYGAFIVVFATQKSAQLAFRRVVSTNALHPLVCSPDRLVFCDKCKLRISLLD